MCQTKLERNNDGSFTVTYGKKTETFSDCFSAVSWAEEQASIERQKAKEAGFEGRLRNDA